MQRPSNMALFGKKDAAPKAEKAPKAKKTTKKVATTGAVGSGADLSWVITKPRITEKAALLGDKNVYVFEIARRATKTDVKKAIETQFKVSPVKVNIVNRAPRRTKSRARNRMVVVHGEKKAHVYLKKGETINLI